MTAYLLAGLGSMLGGGARVLISLHSSTWLSSGFPWDTLFVNLTGSFAIGLYASLSGPMGRRPASSGEQHFIMTGVCGGYTTFSIFSLESIAMLQAAAVLTAACYIVISVMAWLGAVWLGASFGDRLNERGRAG